MKRVIVESPFAAPPGTAAELVAAAMDLRARYLSACLRDCVLRGESPYASHGLLTRAGVLRDHVPEERELGIAAGFVWRDAAELTVFYVDLGWSLGMHRGRVDAEAKGLPFALRRLGDDWDLAFRAAD